MQIQPRQTKSDLYYKFLTQAGEAFVGSDPERTARAVRMLEVCLATYLRDYYFPNGDPNPEYAKGEQQRIIVPLAEDEADRIMKIPEKLRTEEKRKEHLTNDDSRKKWLSEFTNAYAALRMQYCIEVIDEHKLLGDDDDWITVEEREASGEEASDSSKSSS